MSRKEQYQVTVAPAVRLRNPKNGVIKTISTGPAVMGWFIGPFMFLMYGMFIIAALNLLAIMIVNYLFEEWTAFFYVCVINAAFSIRGNRMHINHLIKKGWIPCTPDDAKLAGCVWRQEWDIIES